MILGYSDRSTVTAIHAKHQKKFGIEVRPIRGYLDHYKFFMGVSAHLKEIQDHILFV